MTTGTTMKAIILLVLLLSGCGINVQPNSRIHQEVQPNQWATHRLYFKWEVFNINFLGFTAHRTNTVELKPADDSDLKAIISYGYTATELDNDKFTEDAQKMIETLLVTEPWKSRTSRINIWAVSLPSQESGIDDPQNGIEKDTVLGTTLGKCIRRTVFVTEGLRMLELASIVDADDALVLVNSEENGASSIAGFAAISMSKYAASALDRELMHAMTGMQDTYHYRADQKDIDTCEPVIHQKEIATKAADHRRYFANIIVEADIPNSPWANFVENDTEKVDFDFHQGYFNFNDSTNEATYSVTASKNYNGFVIAPATNRAVNNQVTDFKSIKLNGITLSDSYISKVDHPFQDKSGTGYISLIQVNRN